MTTTLIVHTYTQINDSGKKSTDVIISVNDIYDKLCQLKTGKSPGPDQLHPRILYETRDIVVYPLFLIFNQSFKTCTLHIQLIDCCSVFTQA